MGVVKDVGVSAGNVLSWSHTCSGDFRYLLVNPMIGSSTITATAVTYGGVAMTFLGRSVQATLPATVEQWGLVAPFTGSNTVSVTLSGANPGCDNGSASFTGVDSENPTDGNAQGTTGAASAPTTAAKTGVAGVDMLYGIVGSSAVSFATAGAADIWKGSGDNGSWKLADGTSQTVSWRPNATWATEVVLLLGYVPTPYPPPTAAQTGYTN